MAPSAGWWEGTGDGHRAEVFRYGNGWVVRIANELLRDSWREADDAKAVAERVLGITLRHARPAPRRGDGRRPPGRAPTAGRARRGRL
jgi:hypothetical protein